MSYANQGKKITQYTTTTRTDLSLALFKGGLARVIRSSPQFAATLVVYELLHRAAPYPYANKEQASERPVRRTDDIVSGVLLCFCTLPLIPTPAMPCDDDYPATPMLLFFDIDGMLIQQSRIRARNGLRILLDCSSHFGMVGQDAASQGIKSLPQVLKTSKEFH